VAECISKRVSEHYNAKDLDSSICSFGNSSPNRDRGFLVGIGGGVSHLVVLHEQYKQSGWSG
jgi:hypothetical protein